VAVPAAVAGCCCCLVCCCRSHAPFFLKFKVHHPA
jgi:hypothetical protein